MDVWMGNGNILDLDCEMSDLDSRILWNCQTANILLKLGW